VSRSQSAFSSWTCKNFCSDGCCQTEWHWVKHISWNLTNISSAEHFSRVIHLSYVVIVWHWVGATRIPPPNDSNNPDTWPRLQTPEVGPDPDYRSRLRLDSAFFFRTRIRTWSQKFVKNRTRSHFSISAVAGVCAVIS